MYRIGEFSKITGLTTQTLRYYDSEKILSPSYRNEENGYRYYSAGDIETAQSISLLRRFNFSIMEIKDVLSNMKTQEDFHDFVNEKIVLTENLIIQYSSLIDEMKSYLALSPLEKKEVKNMEYEVNISELSSQLVASIRFKGKYCEIGEYFTKVFECAGEKVCGIPFTCYYNLDFTETADIEVCVPVSSSVFGNSIQTKTIESVHAIGVKHIGAYEYLGMAYKSLFDYANRNNLEYVAPIIEFYDKSMGCALKGNPDKYETRIYLPIKK
ncbi:MerR family transcriptional regulator [Enterocloster citroniae]|uniref:MerR family transcriptional regulator n=1 Tax=Enterocloster citroniae TaxID=358743 RepID=UPI000E3F574A|nr:MerR family transcriptional regulator [Enterocloster citroniae]RGC13087.1 MerR family transcriptional regulator [Enterocloster citroniae]